MFEQTDVLLNVQSQFKNLFSRAVFLPQFPLFPSRIGRYSVLLAGLPIVNAPPAAQFGRELSRPETVFPSISMSVIPATEPATTVNGMPDCA